MISFSEAIKKLVDKRDSKGILKLALKEIIFNYENMKVNIFIFIASLIPSFIIGWSTNTVTQFIDVAGLLVNTIVTLFGVIFTGYSLFQALIGEELLKRLLTTKSKKKDISFMQENNEYFINIMLLNFICVFMGIFTILIVKNLPANALLPLDITVNNILATLGIWIYLGYNLIVLWEIKSFVYNVFQLFNAHAASKGFKLMNDLENEINQDSEEVR